VASVFGSGILIEVGEILIAFEPGPYEKGSPQRHAVKLKSQVYFRRGKFLPDIS